MFIALDFDETYTQDPDLWCKFIDEARDNEHEVYIVTARPDDGDNFDIELSKACHVLKVPVIYCHYTPKRFYCKEVYGITFDVWIDDSPEAIVSRTDEIGYDCI